MNEWKYIDEVVINDDTTQIHCDTRDFCMFITNETIESALVDFIQKIRKKSQDIFNSCIFKDFDEIKNYLKDLERYTGGKGNWRFITFMNPKESSKYLKGWHKYFRFVKTEFGWFCYTTCGADYFVIRKDFACEDNLVKEMLNKQ